MLAINEAIEKKVYFISSILRMGNKEIFFL